MELANCVLDTYSYKHTFKICNSYCLCTATIVARTRLKVKLYLHCPSFFIRPYRKICEKRLLASLCLSVRPREITRLPLDGFSWNFLFEDFPNLCREDSSSINPLNPELNSICYLLALLGAHRFLHVSRIRVKLLTFRRLMSYIYGAPILDVSRSHTTTQHSR